MRDLNHTIRVLEGSDFEEEHYAHCGLLFYGLAVLGGMAFIGAGYCVYRACEALFG